MFVKIKIDENLKIFNCIPINLIEPPEKTLINLRKVPKLTV